MSDPAAPGAPDAASDEVMGNGVFRAVLEGYDAVYAALPRGETFNRFWRMNACHGDFPGQFAHIGFLTAGEAQRLHGMLHIRPGEALVDLACGAGGPGLWMARESGASLIGIDPSAAGLAAARQRCSPSRSSPTRAGSWLWPAARARDRHAHGSAGGRPERRRRRPGPLGRPAG